MFLNDVRTPVDWIIGKRGEGWNVSRTTLKHERNSIGAASQTKALFRGLVDLAKKTERNGKPAIEDSEIRQRLVELEGYVRSHQYSGYIQLTRDSRGESPGLLSMMNKLISTNIGHTVAGLSLGHDRCRRSPGCR